MPFELDFLSEIDDLSPISCLSCGLLGCRRPLRELDFSSGKGLVVGKGFEAEPDVGFACEAPVEGFFEMEAFVEWEVSSLVAEDFPLEGLDGLLRDVVDAFTLLEGWELEGWDLEVYSRRVSIRRE